MTAETAPPRPRNPKYPAPQPKPIPCDEPAYESTDDELDEIEIESKK
jgi:hypothetical protein